MNMSPFSWYVALLAGGLLLIAAEVFIPGGVAGVAGGLALLAAMGVGLFHFPAPWGFWSAVAIVVFGGIVFLLWIQLFPRSRTGKRITFRANLPAPLVRRAGGSPGGRRRRSPDRASSGRHRLDRRQTI